MIVTPNLHFQGNCQDALKVYEKAFAGKLTVLLHYSDANPSDFSTVHLSDKEKNFIYHAEMIIGDQRFMFSDAMDEIPQGQNLSIVITFDTAEEVKNAYKALSEGSSVIYPLTETTYSSCFVSLVDKFGIRWELMTEDNS